MVREEGRMRSTEVTKDDVDLGVIHLAVQVSHNLVQVDELGEVFLPDNQLRE